MDEKRHFTTQEVLDWFAVTKPIPKKNISPPKLPCPPAARTVNKHVHVRPSRAPREPPRPPAASLDDSYADLAAAEPSDSYYQQLLKLERDFANPETGEDGEERLHDMSETGLTTTSVFENYSFDNDSNPKLPISSYRDAIVRMIESGQVTIIQGCTGSGKSTQVPQYILEHYARERRHCNIICTQPRRIAAVSVAKFVAKSRGWRLGSLVGYQIAMDKFVSEDTRLNFVTTGVLLQKLVGMKNMNQYTHIILDEVHERDLDTDFCLLVVRKLLRTNSKHVKVVLMSATIENELFANYFGVRVCGRLEPAPVLQVEGKGYSVIDFCLDDIIHIGKAGNPIDESSSPRLRDDTLELACKLIKTFDALEEQKKQEHSGSSIRGTVLVFLPGMPEILRMADKLTELVPALNLKDLAVLHLHSSINEDNQRLVFLPPEPGKRKVILSTNIAESSITVPDIRYVIDFCLVKELMYDADTNYQCLKLNWASKASLTQRKGRAGRVADGRCYRLITRSFYHDHTEPHSTPEMQRCPLDSVVLHCKQLDLGDPCSILSLALQPPNLCDIERSILTLKEVGALTVMCRGVVHPYDGDLTFVGQVLASLPVDVRVGKLLILGHVFGCLGECIVIGAALSLRPFFSTQRSQEMRGYRSKMGYAEYSFSDCIAILNAYKEWCRLKMSGQFQVNGRDEKAWCSSNCVNKNTIHSLAELVKELSSRLATFNIKSFKPLVSRYDVGDEQDILILKLVIAGAFYPHYFRWGLADNEQAQKVISGHDPATTVMLSGLPPNPELYKNDIMRMFDDCGKGKQLHFDHSRVYLEFERQRSSRQQDSGLSSVLDAVYVALQKRHMRQELILYVNDQLDLGPKSVTRQQSDRGFGLRQNGHSQDLLQQVELPKKGCHHIMVSEVVHPTRFWAHLFEEHNQEVLANLMSDINRCRLVPLRVPVPGMLCLAVYSRDGLCYRARVEGMSEVKPVIVRVVFVDYGNEEWVALNRLFLLPPELKFNPPAQAFECCLTNIKPSYRLSAAGKWSQQSIHEFQQLVADKILLMNVYSEVGGVLHIELWDKSDPSCSVFINKKLVEENLATFCEESPSSQFAHELAQTKFPSLPSGVAHSHCVSVDWQSDLPHSRASLRNGRSTRTTRHTLKGPVSPYEVSFYPMVRSSSGRAAKIARDSVNSIVVDSEPQDKHERLMVASQVSVNSSGSMVLARYTTLLPNLHGLPYVVCLLFAPTVEMRTDPLKRQYTGVLCGLGYDPATGESLYLDHDMELVFDTLITQDDLDSVNDVRMAINIAVGSNDAVAEWGEKAVRDIQHKARTLLLRLVLICRDSITQSQTTRSAWNQVSFDDLLPPKQPGQDEDIPTIYPLHHGIRITGEVVDQSQSSEKLLLRQQLTELHKMASRSLEPMHLFCNVCHTNLSCPNALLRHLDDPSHKLLERAVFDDTQTTLILDAKDT